MAAHRPFIDPTRSRVTVPPLLQRVRVAKQRDIGRACGLYAVVTAARKLGTMLPRAGAPTLLANLEPATRVQVEARLPRTVLLEKNLRALANAAGLSMYRPNTHDLTQFHEPNWLWIALVLVRFAPPNGVNSHVGKHLVLVLNHLPSSGTLVVADPHPWNPPVYCVDEREFERAWRAAKTKGPPWAAALDRARRFARIQSP